MCFMPGTLTGVGWEEEGEEEEKKEKEEEEEEEEEEGGEEEGVPACAFALMHMHCRPQYTGVAAAGEGCCWVCWRHTPHACVLSQQQMRLSSRGAPLLCAASGGLWVRLWGQREPLSSHGGQGGQGKPDTLVPWNGSASRIPHTRLVPSRKHGPAAPFLPLPFKQGAASGLPHSRRKDTKPERNKQCMQPCPPHLHSPPGPGSCWAGRQVEPMRPSQDRAWTVHGSAAALCCAVPRRACHPERGARGGLGAGVPQVPARG